MKLSKLLPLFLCTPFIASAPLNEEVAATFEKVETRDYAVLTEFFKAIKDTNVAPSLVKLLAGNKITEPILVNAIVGFLKISNLDDLLSAVDKSGLTVDIVLKALQDEKFFPGAYAIIDGLKNGASSTPTSNSVNVVALTTDVGSVVDSYQEYASDGLGDVLNEISDNLGIGSGNGIFSYLNPVFNLFGVKGTGDSSGEEISLSPSATAVASGAATGTAKATATGTGTKTSSTASSTNTGTATKASSTATSSATSTSSSDSSSGSSSSNWLSGLFNQVRGWFSKRDFVEDDVDFVQMSKRDNEILNNLVDSLQESGLAMQVVVAIIEDSSNYPFARDLIKSIVKKKAITIDSLKSALDSTNLLNNGVIGALQSPDLGITIS